jgi:hypothetical protein
MASINRYIFIHNIHRVQFDILCYINLDMITYLLRYNFNAIVYITIIFVQYSRLRLDFIAYGFYL